MDLQTAKKEWFPPANFVNLNAGATFPTPLPALKRAEAWRRQIATDPVGTIWLDILVEIEANRSRLATFLNAPEKQLLLLPNTTFAINTVIQSLDLSRGDEIIMTDQEYDHYHPLWQKVATSSQATIKIVELPQDCHAEPQSILDAFEAARTPKTRILFFSHVTSPTGLTLPAQALCSWAQHHSLTSIVDGAHASGLIDVDITSLNCDFYAGNMNKWLMGPVGSAFLYVAKHQQATLQPLVITGESVYEESKSHQRKYREDFPTYWMQRFEYQGTQDRSAHTAIATVLSLREQITEQAIRERQESNRQAICECMQKRNLVRLSPDHAQLRSAMVACRIQPVDRIKIWKWVRAQGFEVGFPAWQNHTIMRLSGSWLATPNEIEKFFEIFDRVPWQDLQ